MAQRAETVETRGDLGYFLKNDIHRDSFLRSDARLSLSLSLDASRAPLARASRSSDAIARCGPPKKMKRWGKKKRKICFFPGHDGPSVPRGDLGKRERRESVARVLSTRHARTSHGVTRWGNSTLEI